MRVQSICDEIFAYHIRNVQIGGTFEHLVDEIEIDLARIELSCHFAFDLICNKEGAHDSA